MIGREGLGVRFTYFWEQTIQNMKVVLTEFVRVVKSASLEDAHNKRSGFRYQERQWQSCTGISRVEIALINQIILDTLRALGAGKLDCS